MIVMYKFDRIVYLGSNSLKGIAQESAMRMLEFTTGKVCTMFDTPLGIRHGPKLFINDNTLCVVYLSDNEYSRQFEIDLIKEMNSQRKGNKILAVSSYQDDEVASLVDYYISLNTTLKMNNILLSFNYIIVAQLIALFKALSYKITPDNPCPSGEVNRVVKGVTIYPYKKED
ncbi:MAG: SIS domain-containing protein [Erysipelotrichaceae bacterium]